jgi:hypothetical protein
MDSNAFAHCAGMAFHLSGKLARTSGDGCADVNTANPVPSRRRAAFAALPPTNTTARSFGSRLMSSRTHPARVLLHHGVTLCNVQDASKLDVLLRISQTT